MCSPQPAVAVQELAVDPATLGRAQEAHDVGAILRKTDTASRGLPGEVLYLLGVHPARVCWARVDDVRHDAEISKLPRRSEDNAVQRSLACAVGQVARNVVAEIGRASCRERV